MIHPVLKKIPLETIAETTLTTTTSNGVSIIICGRYSEHRDDEQLLEAMAGNDTVPAKFI